MNHSYIFLFLSHIKISKGRKQWLAHNGFSLHSPKTCKGHVTNWILLRLQIHSKGVCSIKIKTPELLYLVGCTVFCCSLPICCITNRSCLKCELAIGEHSGELSLLGHFLPERTVQLQKSKISSSDLRYSFCWTVVTKVVKFAFWSDGWFYQSRSGSATATEALSCQLKRKLLSTNGWFDSRALPCKCNSSPSTKTWWWMPQLYSYRKMRQHHTVKVKAKLLSQRNTGFWFP